MKNVVVAAAAVVDVLVAAAVLLCPTLKFRSDLYPPPIQPVRDDNFLLVH